MEHGTKSKYYHLTNNDICKITDVISLVNGIRLKPTLDGYNWLGFWLCDSNDISDIFKFHISKKMINIIVHFKTIGTLCNFL